MPKPKGEKRERQQQCPFSCVGCGDAACGYFYQAPACASCKIFFRRVVLKEKEYLTCYRSGECANNSTARPCRSCRFDRCVKGGMNPLSITALENADKNSVVLRVLGASDSKSPFTSNRNVSFKHQENTKTKQNAKIVKNPAQIECTLEKIMQGLRVLEDAYHQLRTSTYSPKLVPGLSLDDFAGDSSKLSVKFERMHVQSYAPESIQLVPEEVFIKQRIPIDFSDFDYTSRKLWMFQDCVYAIEFMKALPVYSRLDTCSKRVLLASAITCSNFTSAFYSYSQQSDRTCYPDGGVMAWSSALQAQSPDSTRFHTVLIAAIREAQVDTREYTLLKMIIVCNPLLADLSARDVVMLQQERKRHGFVQIYKTTYTDILISYVFARRGVKEGPAHFLKLLSIIDVVVKLTSWQKCQHILILAMGLHKHPCPFAVSIFHSC